MHPSVKQLVDNGVNVSISAIVVGELQYGAQKSSRTDSNLVLFSEFLSNFEIVPVDEKVASEYGIVKEQLRKIGVNIPKNDIWIAATALSEQKRLLTYDAHFKSISSLAACP